MSDLPLWQINDAAKNAERSVLNAVDDWYISLGRPTLDQTIRLFNISSPALFVLQCYIGLRVARDAQDKAIAELWADK